MSGLTHARNSSIYRLLTALLTAGLCAIAFIGCSDDDSMTPTGGDQSEIQTGLDGLSAFGVSAFDNTELQVMAHPEISSLMGSMGLGLDALGGIGARTPAGAPSIPHLPRGVARLINGDPSLISNIGRAAVVDLSFGTYVRDMADQTQPFPGWRLLTATPDDGIIFRWDANASDITIDDNGTPTPIAGELRFIGIVIDDTGPGSPSDDIITEMTHEMALGENVNALTTVARIAFSLTLDSSREMTGIAIGNIADLTSTFIGPLSFALSMDMTADDLDLAVRLADLTTDPAYVVSLGLSVVDVDPITEIPSSLTFSFGYGETNDGANPPWLLATTLDDFVAVGQDDFVAAVNGTISFQSDVLATFTGDTTETQVDFDANGDGVVDSNDTCVNVQITFTGTRESQSICEAFGGVNGIGLGTLVSRPSSPLLWLD